MCLITVVVHLQIFFLLDRVEEADTVCTTRVTPYDLRVQDVGGGQGVFEERNPVLPVPWREFDTQPSIKIGHSSIFVTL